MFTSGKYGETNYGGGYKILPTHIIAPGGVISNSKNEILLVKNPRKGLELMIMYIKYQ